MNLLKNTFLLLLNYLSHAEDVALAHRAGLHAAAGKVHLSSIQVLILQEAAEELNRGEWLILRNSVASTLHGGVGEFLVLFNVSCSRAIDEPRSPVLGESAIQLIQTLLRLTEGNSSNINIATVDKDGDIRALIDHIAIERNHRLTALRIVKESERHALGPDAAGRGMCVEGILHILAVKIVVHSVVDGL